MTPLYEQMGLPSNVVYLRAVDRADLSGDALVEFDEAKYMFGVYAEDGQQIALVDDQKTAIELAEEHRFALHLVH
tara:strand:- start:17411 stop:17635 length:225 start_codon:yes stop_codon:yes gene_type:complete